MWPGGYSNSASASAVRLEGDQLTGFLPRKMCPSVNILPNTCAAPRRATVREEEEEEDNTRSVELIGD